VSKPTRRTGQRTKPGQGQSADEIRAREMANVPGLAARVAAARVIADVLTGPHALDERFSPSAVPSRVAGLDIRDTALARSIATVALRRLGTIRHALAALLEKGLPRQAGQLEWLLIVAAAQILFLDVPDHAAVDLAVRESRLDAKTAPFAALINGVLRNLARRREEFLSASDPLDQDTPAWLAARWRKHYGQETAHAIAAAHREEPRLDLSVKSDPQGWAERLGGMLLPTGSVRLRSHEPVAELPGYSDGEWWVQDAAAALPVRLLAPRPGERVLDLCAAPGGKTAQIATAGAQVTALDRSAERLRRLTENLERLHLHAEVIVADAMSYSGGPFDAILLDAPCASTGTIRRHPDVAWTKRPGDIETLTALQTRMLDRAATLLAPGGRLVYCSCSLEPEEGEAHVPALLRRNPDLRLAPITEEDPIPAEFVTSDGTLRTLPNAWPHDEPRLAGLDGFFAARFQRVVG
jgi:16S rRNA (cytosine967-C5)-methyltransferase